jgi:uncharacterized protein (TIGR02118 family)
MIKAIATFSRKPGWSVDEFLCHYKERHAPLVAGTAGFTRHCRRYVQNYPYRASAYHRPERVVQCDAISEMWFDSLEEMSATYAAPDYLERARPDELRFADFNSACVYVCEEHDRLRRPDPSSQDKRWAHLPLVKLFLFHSAEGPDWTHDPDFARSVCRHVFSRRLFINAADLPTPQSDRTAGIDELSFESTHDALAFMEHEAERRPAVDTRALLAHSHLVFSTE